MVHLCSTIGRPIYYAFSQLHSFSVVPDRRVVSCAYSEVKRLFMVVTSIYRVKSRETVYTLTENSMDR